MKFRLLILIVLPFLFAHSAISASNTLKTADSLFQIQKYTSAFEIYESIYSEGTATPAMLARMSFIKEGLGDFTSALYYLEKYYQISGNKKALLKMYELAESNTLDGYEPSDSIFLLHYLRNYLLEIIAILAMIAIGILYLIYKARRKKERPYGLVLFQILLMIGIGILANHLLEGQEAITKSNQTILMEGPSAGSSPITYLKKGNKLKVISTDQVWTQVRYGTEVAFIRTNQLLLL